MKKLIEATLIFIIVMTLRITSYAQDCLFYDPAAVELSGTLNKKTINGETIWTIKLKKPICVEAKENVTEKNVEEIELILLPEKLPRYNTKLQEKAKAKIVGTLFHSQTEDDYTKVLVDVNEIGEDK